LKNQGFVKYKDPCFKIVERMPDEGNMAVEIKSAEKMPAGKTFIKTFYSSI
jgi:hypothetical protein